MYVLTNVNNPFAPSVLAETSTVADAIAALSEHAKVYLVEEDDMNPNHFDLITWQGGLYTIEPKKEHEHA